MSDRMWWGFCVLIFLTLSCTLSAGSLFPSLGEIKPAEQYLVFGEEVQINCSLNQSIIDISQLHFEIGNLAVPTNLTSVLDDKTLQCTVPVTEEFFRAGNNNIVCWNTTLNSSEYSPISGVYHVEYAVIYNVTNLTCVIDKTSRSIQCSWILGKYHLKPRIKVKFSVSINGNGWVMGNVSADTRESCTFNESNGIVIHPLYISFKVEVTNIMRNVTEKFIKTYNPADIIVKPEKVQYMHATDISSRSALIVWILPTSYPLYIRLTFSSKWHQDSQIIEINRRNSTVLVDLKPDTRYTVSIDVRLFTDGVLYSDPTSYEFTTKTDVPDLPPAVNPAGFDLSNSLCHSHTGTDTRNITVYWNSIPEEHKNGHITHYSVIYTSNTGKEDQVVVSGDKFSATMTLKCELSYDIKVQAKNSAGYSNVSTLIKIPSDRDSDPLDDIVVEVPRDERHVVISWDRKKTDDAYVVAWCQKIADNTGCNGDVTFSAEYASGTSNVTMPRSDVGEDIHNIRFGVARKTKQKMSGITWEKCRYRQDLDPQAPKKFQVASVNPDNALTGKWSLPECDWQSGYIQRYRMKHCKVNNGNLDNCQDTEFGRDDNMEFVIRDLKANQNYSLQLQTISPANMESPYVDPVFGVPTTSELGSGEFIAIIIGSVFMFILVLSAFILVVRIAYRKVKAATRPLPIDVPNTSKKLIYEMGPPSPVSPFPGIDRKDDRRSSTSLLLTRQESQDSGTGSLEIPLSPKVLLDSIKEKNYEITTELHYNNLSGKVEDPDKGEKDHMTEENNGKQEKEHGKEEKVQRNEEENNLGKEKEEHLPNGKNGSSRATLSSFIPPQEPSIIVYKVTMEPQMEPRRDGEEPMMLRDFAKEYNRGKEEEFTDLSYVDNDTSVQSADLFGSGSPDMAEEASVEDKRDKSLSEQKEEYLSSGEEIQCDLLFHERDSGSEQSTSNHVSVSYVTHSALDN
ncbi:hypothetical protein FSP39_010306 [Pinctada imbricata]|uniref:Fibronectin type-III domain-containing protein n=1 Tax=Pinctada imbricata TaxID=66713 RepID=A0AA88XXI6_PINIB|nr:hypothetical protein FSP39_010306 [Pinctada imbricata]